MIFGFVYLTYAQIARAVIIIYALYSHRHLP